MGMTKYSGSVELKFSFIAADEESLQHMTEQLEDSLMGIFGVDEVSLIDVYDEQYIPNEEGWLDL